jgi:hypothetical protein
MNGIGQGWQAAVVVADKAVAFTVGRAAGSPAHALPAAAHGGLSAMGLALLAAIAAGAVAATVLGGRLRRRTATRPAAGAPMGGAHSALARTPGFDGRPAVVRARRATGSAEDGRPGRDERR